MESGSESGTAWSSSCSIEWSDREGEGVTRERVGRVEGELGESEVVTDITGHISWWLRLVSDIGNEERVSDVKLHSSPIQSEGSSPTHHHMRHTFATALISDTAPGGPEEKQPHYSENYQHWYLA